MPHPGEGGSDWRALLLDTMGAAASELNIDALQWWADSEGMPLSANNWLATTEPGFGGVPYNSAGVKSYPTIQDGVDATWATLSFHAYANVVTAFRNGTSLEDIWSAVNSSPWCGGCQAGLYPVVLFNHLHAVVSSAPPPAPGAPPPAGNGPGQSAAVTAWGHVQTALHETANQQIGMLIAMSQAARGFRQ